MLKSEIQFRIILNWFVKLIVVTVNNVLHNSQPTDILFRVSQDMTKWSCTSFVELLIAKISLTFCEVTLFLKVTYNK